MVPLFSSMMWMLLVLVLRVVSFVLLDSSLIDLINPVSCPPILWSSWNAVVTIEDEKVFFLVGGPWDHAPH